MKAHRENPFNSTLRRRRGKGSYPDGYDPAWLCGFAYLSSTMRSMRRSGSAAPHSSWSPTVKADR